MNELMVKLKAIEFECDPDAANKKKPKKAVDEFAEKKDEIQKELKQIRKDLKERDELVQRSAQSRPAVEAAAKVRSAIGSVREDAEILSQIQIKQAKKVKKAESEMIVAHRKEVVDLIFKHIEELERLEKNRPLAQEEGRTSLFGKKKEPKSSGATTYITNDTTSKGFQGGSYVPAEGGLLPDIEEGLKKLEQKNKIIDDQLEEIEAGVLALKELANQMNTQLDTQNVMIQDISTDADKANAHLRDTNLRLKNALDKVRKGDRFIMDFILIIILLGIGTYIYNQLK